MEKLLETSTFGKTGKAGLLRGDRAAVDEAFQRVVTKRLPLGGSSREASERVKPAVIAIALSGCLQPDLIPVGEAKKQAGGNAKSFFLFKVLILWNLPLEGGGPRSGGRSFAELTPSVRLLRRLPPPPKVEVRQQPSEDKKSFLGMIKR